MLLRSNLLLKLSVSEEENRSHKQVIVSRTFLFFLIFYLPAS